MHWEKERKELKESINNISNKLPTWTEEVKQEVAKIDWKLKEITSKEWMEKIAGEWLNLAKSWIGEAISWLFDFLSKIPFIGWLFAALGKMFWFWAKVEEVKNEIKENSKKIFDLNTPENKETLTQTEDTIIWYLEKNTWEKFNEETKTRLKTKLSPNNEWSYINKEDFEKLTNKIKSWEKISINDLKDTWIILKIMKDPDFKEMKEILSKDINKKLFVFFKSKFEKSWITFNPENEWKLKWIIKKEVENTSANQIIERTKANWWNVHFDWLEWIESTIWIWILIPNIIFESYKEWIIETKNLAIWLIESWTNTISIWLKALDWQDIIPDLIWRMSWDDFDEKLYEVSPEKKLLLERAFYSELWLVSSVLWTIWFYWTSSLVSLVEWWNNKIIWNNFTTPPIDKLEKTLNILWEWKWAYLWEVKEVLKDTQRSYEIVKKLENWNLDNATKELLKKELSEISWKFEWKWTWILDLNKEKLTKIYKNLNPIQTYYFDKSINELKQITKTNERLWIAIIEWNFSKKVREAKQFIDSCKIRYINWQAVLNISEWLNPKDFSKAMLSLSPEIVQWLFKVAPILIVWETLWNSTKEQKWEWYETLYMLNWLVWWMQLFKDTEIDYTEEWLKIKNPESFAWWIALVWMETFFITKEFLKYISKWQILRALTMPIINSFVRLPLDAVKWIWWASVRWYETLKIAKSFLEKSPKKWKIWIWAALLFWSVLAIEYASADEINSDKLEKDWFIKNWNINTEKLKEVWNTIEEDKKEEIISLYCISLLEKSFKWKEDNFNFKLENWIFNINVNKKIENETNLINNLIWEEISRFLTDVNSNIKLKINSF